MITKVNEKWTCRFEGCTKSATTIACGQNYLNEPGGHPAPAAYCETHARVVADERAPEYIVDCPNCGCHFGVN